MVREAEESRSIRQALPAEFPSHGIVSRPAPVTDSPWLWLAIFLLGALVALLLTLPKYSWRQPQLERQYHARVTAGQAQEVFRSRPAATSTDLAPKRPALLISLRPLALVIVTGMVCASIGFWWTRRYVHVVSSRK